MTCVKPEERLSATEVLALLDPEFNSLNLEYMEPDEVRTNFIFCESIFLCTFSNHYRVLSIPLKG